MAEQIEMKIKKNAVNVRLNKTAHIETGETAYLVMGEITTWFNRFKINDRGWAHLYHHKNSMAVITSKKIVKALLSIGEPA